MTEKKSECKNNFWGKYVARKFIHTFGPLYYMIDSKSGEERAKNFQANP